MPDPGMNPEEREKRLRQRFCDDVGFIVIPADGRPPYHIDGTPLSDADELLVQQTRAKVARKNAK